MNILTAKIAVCIDRIQPLNETLRGHYHPSRFESLRQLYATINGLFAEDRRN